MNSLPTLNAFERRLRQRRPHFGVGREREQEHQRAAQAQRRRLPGQGCRDHHAGNPHRFEREGARLGAQQRVE
jgi:hypothetical protein